MSPPRLLLTLGLLTLGAVLSPLGVGAALAHPVADFNWNPNPVVAGTAVTFTSTSTPTRDPNEAPSPIATYDWNLHGRGACGNVPTCTGTAPAAGNWDVTLTVTDLANESTSITKTIAVRPPAVTPNARPTAAFAALPSSPLVGEEVTFVSYSDDPDGRINGWAWDLDGDGRFDDGGRPIVTRSYTQAGLKTVRLRVTDNRGATSTASFNVTVRNPGMPAVSNPQQPLPPLLSPFPIVRLLAAPTSAGTDIALLSVRAPKGSQAMVRCRGRGCPSSRFYRKVRTRRTVHFAGIEKLIKGRVVIEVLVRRGNRIGKFTRFKFRHNRRWRRSDGCLWPGTNRMAPCPED